MQVARERISEIERSSAFTEENGFGLLGMEHTPLALLVLDADQHVGLSA